jgi:hypothetical protein
MTSIWADMRRIYIYALQNAAAAAAAAAAADSLF